MEMPVRLLYHQGEVSDMKFQEKLQALRKEKGISQEQLAANLGISRQAVAKWEAGQSLPDLDKLIALSDFFKMSMDRLVKDNSDENCSFEGSHQDSHASDAVIDFLIRAKKATYAGGGAGVAASRTHSHDLQYAEDGFSYYDTYLGGERFAGEEAVWRNEDPIWAMNYVGRLVAEGFSGDFLKECLFLVSKDYPYRGPLVHQNGEYAYHCVINGEFGWFSGYEEIFCNGVKVYECLFHGGYVK